MLKQQRRTDREHRSASAVAEARTPRRAAPSFSILGPLEVASSGQMMMTPPAQKIRTVLAALLVSDNSVLSVSALIRELWKELPPKTALQALRVYVSQLRRILDQLGDDPFLPRLVTQQPGYRLEIEAGSLDTMEFDRLCEKGRQSGSAQHFELAARHYQHALGLWRGPALSDVRGGPLLEGAALRLEESRLAALARRIDLDLRLGRHLDLVAELKVLTTAHPLNESLQARLMIALCRSGRTSEALGGYRRVRSSLAEQLAVEPSQELRRVHQAVLTSDDQIFEQVDLWAL